MPLSSIAMATVRPSVVALSEIEPCGSVNLAALFSRFENTCARRVGSASSSTCSLGISTDRRPPAAVM